MAANFSWARWVKSNSTPVTAKNDDMISIKNISINAIPIHICIHICIYSHLLTTSCHCLEGFGKRCFAHVGPSPWNTTPISIKCAQSIDTFKGSLKTHLFNVAYSKCDVTFLSYCVYFPSFCLVSGWYHKRFWAWRLVAVEIGAIGNWYYYYHYCYYYHYYHHHHHHHHHHHYFYYNNIIFIIIIIIIAIYCCCFCCCYCYHYCYCNCYAIFSQISHILLNILYCLTTE